MRNPKLVVLLIGGTLLMACGRANTPPRSAGHQAPSQSGSVGRGAAELTGSNAQPEGASFAEPPEAASQEAGHGSYRASEEARAAPGAGSPSRTESRGRAQSSRSARSDKAPDRDAIVHRGLRKNDAYEPDARPSYRPGLATHWGETRFSPVSSVEFERATDVPFSTMRLFYNDSEGLRSVLGEPWRWREEFALDRVGPLTVRVVNENGQSYPTYRLGADWYVMGTAGERYVIELGNETAERVEAVVTVDGLDVIDGRPGSFHKRGYLVGPWASVQIDGFRQSNERVAAFRFGSVGESYAARKGDHRNVGVIGVAVFEERASRFRDEEELRRRRRADPFPGRYAEPPNTY